MADTRHRNADWTIPVNGEGRVSWEGVHAAVLMDIRDELKRLNRLLHCENFTAIPHILRAVRANTTKPRRKKKGRARG